MSDVAHRGGVNPRTVDYYTTAGLRAPVARSPGGHRFYDEEAVRRLRAIKTLQAQGLAPEALRARLDLPGGNADLLPRVERLREELRRLAGEVAALTPHLVVVPQRDVRARGALQASVTSAASYALTLAQELLDLVNRRLL